MFTKELIQAISNWQRGGDSRQKARRGKVLKEVSLALPVEFRSTQSACFRQIGLNEPNLLNLGVHYGLPESISSWTEDEAVAKEFKGGVPSQGGDYIGVIFRFHPPQSNVIINLSRLLDDPDFLAGVDQWKSEIDGFSSGLGRYGNSQKEVVMEVSELPLDSIYAWGGFTRTRSQLKRMLEESLGLSVTEQAFDSLMVGAGHQIGQYWMKTPDAIARIADVLKYHADRVKRLVEKRS